jgi:colanic acid biosynthesis protein WcaH
VIKGETMIATAQRKALDEVGIRVHVGPIVHTDETIFNDGPCGIAVHSINSCFFVYPEDPDFSPALDSHHSDWQWVNAIDSSLHQYVKQCLSGAGLKEST